MIEIGKINELQVSNEDDTSYFLVAEGSDEEARMPKNRAPKDIVLNQRLSAFVYLDSDDCLLATPKIPHACVGEFALMQAVTIQNFGAFLEWGIEKDLLVPDTEQRDEIRQGQSELIRVCLDEKTNRIYGTTKINKYIQASEFDIVETSKVKIVPVLEEELGYRCVINRKYIGMIYRNEIFKQVEIGEVLDGVVKKLRSDGLVDAALQTQGIKNLVESKDIILNHLQENGGKSPLWDKSDPQLIRDTLGMSKQTFKNTIGMLYRERKILISKEGIELVPEKS